MRYFFLSVYYKVQTNVKVYFSEDFGSLIIMPPFVGMSVSLNLVQLITQEGFAPEASNLVGR